MSATFIFYQKETRIKTFHFKFNSSLKNSMNSLLYVKLTRAFDDENQTMTMMQFKFSCKQNALFFEVQKTKKK